MPLLVARRWPVVTRFPAALASRRPVQRFYTAPPPSSSGCREGARAKLINGGIIIPDSVQTHPHHLLESIKPLPPLHAPKRNFAVFFVTPSYAHFLLDDNAFLCTALRRIYKEVIGIPDLTISALCAVVDKLPAPQPWNDQTLESQLSLRKRSSPLAGTGFEGIAYVSLPPHASVPSNESSLPSEHGAIDFITADYASKDETCLDTLRLPLANTVFQTGMPTTMFYSSWKTDGNTGKLTQVAKTTPSCHAIRLVESSSAPNLESVLSIPLLPLTLPRVVEGCMGNIIRRVVDADGNSIQASSELENVVPRFFSSRNQPAQATVAWALVIPKNLKQKISTRTEELLASLPAEDSPNSTSSDHAWERLWRSDPPVWNTLVSQALSEGARLHRVLSGGGGWGKKAGLLSLDPVPANKSSGSPTGPESLTIIDDPGNFESTLTPVVQDGDSIQFFTLPKSDLTREARESDNYETVSKMADANASGGWELGTIPSTMDSIPGESWQHMRGEKRRSAFFQDSFGALTEGALTITRRRRNDLYRTSSVYTTTLDAPFSRFWAINPARSQDSISRQKGIDHVGKDKDVVPNLNKLHFSSSNHVPNSSPRHIRNVWTNCPSNLLQPGVFRLISNADRPMSICRFSSTALTQDRQSGSVGMNSKSPTVGVAGPRSTDQTPELGQSQGRPHDSSIGVKGLQSTAPKMTIPELIRALGVTGVHMSSRLRARTARIMMYEIRRRFNEQMFEYRAITSGRYRQKSGRANSQSAQLKPKLDNKSKGESITRQVPLEAKGDFRKEQRDTRKSNDIKRRKDSTHDNTHNKRVASPKKGKTQGPPIRKLSIQPKRTPETLRKSLHLLSFQVSRLADEVGPVIATIRSRYLRTTPQSQTRSPARTPQPHPSAPRKKNPDHTYLHRLRNPKTQSHTRIRHVRVPRLQVRRVRARPPVAIKLYPSSGLGTIRFPDGRRAKLKRRLPPRRLLRSSSSRIMPRRVPVNATVAVPRKREAARLQRKREREARRLAETVESWLGGGGTGSKRGMM